MRKTTLALALAIGTVAPALAQHMAPSDMATVGEIVIHHPWARASLGTAPNSAAYMMLEATGAEADRLVGGSTPAAEEVQLHTHIMEDGIAKMRPVEAIEVAPGTPTVLEPGGLHVMLVGLTGPLDEGATLPLTLVFETAGEIALDLPVKGLQADMDHGGHGDMDHSETGDGEMDHGEGH